MKKTKYKARLYCRSIRNRVDGINEVKLVYKKGCSTPGHIESSSYIDLDIAKDDPGHNDFEEGKCYLVEFTEI